MSKFGKQVIKSLKEFLADAKAGKPMKQVMVRRMQVKGKTVYTHETFTAPLTKESDGSKK